MRGVLIFFIKLLAKKEELSTNDIFMWVMVFAYFVDQRFSYFSHTPMVNSCCLIWPMFLCVAPVFEWQFLAFSLSFDWSFQFISAYRVRWPLVILRVVSEIQSARITANSCVGLKAQWCPLSCQLISDQFKHSVNQSLLLLFCPFLESYVGFS